MITINLHVGSRFPVNRKKIRESVIKVLTEHAITHVELEISIVGNRKITQLNQERLGHEGPTDVLSFPLHEKNDLKDFPLPANFPPHLGSIVVSYPAAIDQARKFGRLVDDQLCFFVEHGLMHLLGYHHEDE